MIRRLILLILISTFLAVILNCGGSSDSKNPVVSPIGPPKGLPEVPEETGDPFYFDPVTEPLPNPILGAYFDSSTDSNGRAMIPGSLKASKDSIAALPMKISVVDREGLPLRHVVVRRFFMGDDFMLFIWDPSGFYNPRFVHSETITRSTTSKEDTRSANFIDLLGTENLASTSIGIGATSIDLAVGLDQVSEIETKSISTYKSYFIENNLLGHMSKILYTNLFARDIVRFSGTYTRWNLPRAVSTLTDNGALIFTVGYVDTHLQKLSTFRMGTPDDDLDDNTHTNSFISPRIPSSSQNSHAVFSNFMQVRAGADHGAIESAFETAWLNHPLHMALGDEQRYMLINFKVLHQVDQESVTSPKRRVDNMVLIVPVDPHALLLLPGDGSFDFKSGVTKIFKLTAKFDLYSTYPVKPTPNVDNWFRNSVGVNIDPRMPGDIISQPGQGLLPSVTLLAELNRYVSVTHLVNDYFDDPTLKLTSNVIEIVPEGGSVTNLRPDLSGVTAVPAQGRAPLTVTFDATSAFDPDGSIVSYQWDFGNPDVPGGGSSTVAKTQHTYASPGVRTALLTVVDDGIPPATVMRQFNITISANQPPVAIAEADLTEGRAPLTVKFDGTKSYDPDGQITEFRWDFGDGSNPSYLATPEHTFTEEGNYIVTLRVWDDGPGTQRFSEDSLTINVLPASVNQPPIADFTMEPPNGGEAPLTVQFNASNSYDPDGDNITYQWFFGDNDIIGGGTSSQTNPVHIYESPQYVIVTLQVTDDGDPPLSNSMQKEFEVIPKQNEPPVAVINADPDSGLAPLSVSFDGSDSYDPDGEIEAYSWDFGDDTQELGAIVEHEYEDEGVYQVTLVVSDNASPSEIDGATFEVVVGNTRPVAILETDVTEGIVPLTVNFDASNSYDPDDDNLTYFWDFGDGFFSENAVVSHEYDTVGDYIVTLFVFDDKDFPKPLEDSDVVLISVQEPPPNQQPVVIIKAEPYWGSAPLTVEFNSTDESYDPDGDNIISYLWDFAGQGNSEEPNPTFEFTSNGVFPVTCMLADDGDPSEMGIGIKNIYVGVNVPPVAIAEADITEGEFPLTVNFTGSSSYDPDGIVTSYNWQFGTGDSSVDADTEYTYTAAGNYVARLVVYDNNPMLPASGSDEIIIQVLQPDNLPPVARIIIQGSTGPAPLTVQVNAMMSNDPDGSITEYLWNFGDPNYPDGGESTSAIATHTYDDPGEYTIRLTVWDNGSPPKSDTTTVDAEAF